MDVVFKDMVFYQLINMATYLCIIEPALSLKFASKDKGLESELLGGKFNLQDAWYINSALRVI